MARLVRILLLAGSLALLFAVIVAGLLKLIPGPHRQVDYLVIGTLATFASMAVLFLVLIATSLRGREVFFKRRKGGSDATGGR